MDKGALNSSVQTDPARIVWRQKTCPCGRIAEPWLRFNWRGAKNTRQSCANHVRHLRLDQRAELVALIDGDLISTPDCLGYKTDFTTIKPIGKITSRNQKPGYKNQMGRSIGGNKSTKSKHKISHIWGDYHR